MAEPHFDPASYMDLMRAEVPDYDRLQDAIAASAAAGGHVVRRALDLGTGTGNTARRVLDLHPEATLVGIDESADMLAAAQAVLPPAADLRVARLEDPLPDGPFDLVVSALAVHHLDGLGKADLFRRVADVLAPGGRVVLGDVVVPDDPADVVIPLEEGYDQPSPVTDQLAWLVDAGLAAEVAWAHRDLAVLVAEKP
jgi:tRNA (cmo5U34)-methyltransferase